MFKVRFALILALISVGCGRIWGGVTWLNGSYPSSAFNYQCSTQVFLEGVSNNGNTPGLGGSGFSYSISPSLPAGLSLDPNTGIIFGTPTVVNPLTAYTITINYPGGTTTTTVNIRTAIGWLINDLTDDADNAPLTANHCTAAVFGTCTLRAAIDEINTGGSTRTVILLPAGTTANAILTSGLGAMSISQPMDIYGDCAQGTTVDGDSTTQIFNALNSGNISFNALTIQNALSAVVGKGAAINVSNTAAGSFAVGINNSTIQNNINSAASGVGGVQVTGASVAHPVTLTVANTTFYNNQSTNAAGATGGVKVGAAGAAFVSGTITNSTFNANTAAGGGAAGGLAFDGTALTVSDSLFYNNSTSGGGAGGAIVFAISSTGPLTLTNDTFDSNSQTGPGGSGTILGSGIAQNLNVTNCTIANTSGGSAAIDNVPPTNLANNIFYNNVVNCGGSTVGTSLGGNLSDRPSADCTLTQGTDIVSSVSILLGALQGNGGLTLTMAPQSGSAAIDNAVTLNCPPTDQRGYSRLVDGKCDIGAYESSP